VIWGAYHGAFLIIERLFLRKVLDRIGVVPSVLFTFLVVMVGWVFFRMEHLSQAWGYLEKMFLFDFHPVNMTIYPAFKFTCVLAALFSFIGLLKIGRKMEHVIYYQGEPPMKWYYSFLPLSIVLFILSLSSVAAEGFNPFIYFRF